MRKPPGDELRRIIQSLNEHIETSRALGFDDTLRLLRIVRLDLHTKLYGITTAELHALSGTPQRAADRTSHRADAGA